MGDTEIYRSDEYKARKLRARSSLHGLLNQTNQSVLELLETASESIAYWQMRAVQAEQFLYDEGYKHYRNRSNREM